MVVVDSSVIIPLLKIGKLFLLKEYFGKITITKDIYEEISRGVAGVSEFEEACKSWIKTINQDNKESETIAEKEGIEKADFSIIILAENEKEILISNDYGLIIVARTKGVECWWLTTFLLKCMQKNIIKKTETKQILFELIEAGMRLNNEVYSLILKEIDDFRF